MIAFTHDAWFANKAQLARLARPGRWAEKETT